VSWIYLTEIPSSIPADFDGLTHLLSRDEYQKLCGFKRQVDRWRRLAGRLLLWYTLKNHTGWDQNSLPPICYNVYGKPYLPDFDLDFSISHAGSMVACGFVFSGKAGLDVEEIFPVDFADYASILNIDEQAAIRAGKNSLKTFYRIWTRKEAILKAIGTGFLMDPAPFATMGATVKAAGRNWFLHEILLDGHYSAAFASEIPQKPEIVQCPWESLVHYFHEHSPIFTGPQTIF
jgi:4'-phosphopantetheinyl transferase